MSKELFRPAQKEDCAIIAALYSIASDGVSDYIRTTLAEPGEDILSVGRRRYEREDSAFSYRNCVIVKSESDAGFQPVEIRKSRAGSPCHLVHTQQSVFQH